MKRFSPRIYAFSLYLLLWPLSAGAATYTFDSLNAGTIAGQDNWMVLTGSGDTSDIIATGTGFDTTKVMANPNDGGIGTNVHRMGRTNNANFTFGNLSGISGLTLSFDTQVQNNAGQDQFINFGLADANLANASPGFSYRQQFGATPTWGLGASTNSASGSLPSGIATNDWIRLTLTMSFTTNAGQGTGTLFFTDLTNPGGTITLASNFNLMGTGSSSGLWNTMWSRSDFSSNVVQDNLTVQPVPEARSSAFVIAACLSLLVLRVARWRRKA